MKKIDHINRLLAQGMKPKDIVPLVPCSLSLVYHVRGRRGIARMRQQIDMLRQDSAELNQRVRLLEGKPVDILAQLQRGA